MFIKPFTISRLPRIEFGEGRFADLPKLLASYGKRVLVVTGSRSFTASSHWQHLTDGLRGAGIEWDSVQVTGEPSPQFVDETVATYKDSGVSVVLGIGGGSPIDAAKAIAGLLPFGSSVMDHLEGVGRGVPYSGPPTPMIAVPTTSGTGAEATKNAVLSAPGPEGFKKSFRHDSLMPAVAVVDPALTYSCPPELTAAVGMDCLTQLLESYTSTNSSPFTDALAYSGLEAVKDGLFPAVDSDPTGRALMSYAALLSGIGLSQAGLGVVHGLASPLGGFFPIPHSIACGAVLPAATRMNIEVLRERDPENPALEKYAKVGWLLSGRDLPRDEAYDELVDILSSWTKQLGIPGLSSYGIDETGFAKVVAGCGAKANPAALTAEEITEILRESL